MRLRWGVAGGGGGLPAARLTLAVGAAPLRVAGGGGGLPAAGQMLAFDIWPLFSFCPDSINVTESR